MGIAFVTHKFDFSAYAIYCTRLPKARLYYDLTMKEDHEEVRDMLVVSEPNSTIKIVLALVAREILLH